MSKKNFLFILFLVPLHLVWSLPSGATTSGGAAVSTNSSTSMQVTISGDTPTITWDSFSIASNEQVTFTRANSSNDTFYVLNTVTGSSQSQIAGQLTGDSNGHIYLVNPNGVLIKDGATVTIGGFLASSYNLTSTFNPTSNMTFAGTSTETVENKGTITAMTGDAVLIGFRVANSGTMTAASMAGLAAGTEVLLKPSGTDRILISTIVSSGSGGTGIDNSGTLSAVNTSLKADGNAYALAISHTGTIQATGCTNTSDGKIYLVADPGTTSNGSVEVNGSIKRENGTTTGQGPDVSILGAKVALKSNASINTSGALGGGDIAFGGIAAGTESITTTNVYMDPSAQIVADGTGTGNGGDISYYGTTSALVLGSIQSQGASGNGGSLTGTSPGYHGFGGTIDLGSTSGTHGTATLTSSDFIVAGSSNWGSYYQPTAYNPGNIDSVITKTATQSALNKSHLTVVANEASNSGDITVAQDFTWSKINTTLTLNATGALQVNGNVTATGASTATNTILALIANSVSIGNSNFSHTAKRGFDITAGSITADITQGMGVYGGASENAVGRLSTSSGSLDIDIGGDLNVRAGTAAGTNALLGATSTLSIDGQSATSAGDINVIANDCSTALIDGTGGTISIGPTYAPVDVTITGGECSTDNYAYIGSPSGTATITVTVSGDHSITGGSTGTGNNAGYYSASGTSNDFSITGRTLSMTGGAGSSSTNNAALITNYGTGAITINMSQDINLDGGTNSVGSYAFIRGKTVSATATRDFSLQAGNGILNYAIIHGTNGLTAVAGRDMVIQGGEAASASALLRVDQGTITVDNTGGVGGDLDISSSTSGTNNASSGIRVLGDGSIYVGQTTRFNNVTLSAGGTGIDSSATMEVIGDGHIEVYANRDVSLLGGQDGDATHAALHTQGSGHVTVVANQDLNLTTGNNQAANVYVRASNGATTTNIGRDINLTGDCDIPNVASIETIGSNASLAVIATRDITLKGKSYITLNGTSEYNVQHGGNLTVQDCSAINGQPQFFGAPAPNYTDEYWKYAFLYELFYRLNHFVYYDWYLLSVTDFWVRANYTSP